MDNSYCDSMWFFLSFKLALVYPKAQKGSTALHNMVFGPRNLGSLRDRIKPPPFGLYVLGWYMVEEAVHFLEKDSPGGVGGMGL